MKQSDRSLSSLTDALRARLSQKIDEALAAEKRAKTDNDSDGLCYHDGRVDAYSDAVEILEALLLRDFPHDENPLRELLSWAIANLSVYVRQRPQSAGFVEKFKLAEAAIGEGTDLLRDLSPATWKPGEREFQNLREGVRIEDERIQALGAELNIPKTEDRQGYTGRYTPFDIIAELRKRLADLPPAETLPSAPQSSNQEG